MDKQDLIRMAKEAGWQYAYDDRGYEPLWAFAALVAAAAVEQERKEFAVHAIDIARKSIEEEREACANVCENLVLDHPGRADMTADQCAAAIRARGEMK